MEILRPLMFQLYRVILSFVVFPKKPYRRNLASENFKTCKSEVNSNSGGIIPFSLDKISKLVPYFKFFDDILLLMILLKMPSSHQLASRYGSLRYWYSTCLYCIPIPYCIKYPVKVFPNKILTHHFQLIYMISTPHIVLIEM